MLLPGSKLFEKIRGDARIMLLLIVLTAAIVRVLFFTGITHSDDWGYSYDAYRILQGTYTFAIPTDLENFSGYFGNSPHLRYGLLFPIAGIYYLFGVTAFSSILYPLCASLGTLVLVYAIGKLICNEKTGLMAALLLSFYPADVILATQLWPDIPSIFFSTGAGYFLLNGERTASHKCRAYYLAGLFTGLSYLVKENGIYVIFLVGIYCLFQRKDAKIRITRFLLGLGPVLCGEALAYYFMTGDPLFRYHMTSIATAWYFRTFSPNYANVLIGIAKEFLTYLFSPIVFYHGMYFYVTLIAVFFCGVKIFQRASFLLLWFSVVAFFAFYAGYVNATMAGRYTIYLIVPSILLIACFLGEMKLPRLYRGAIIGFLIVTALLSLIAHHARNKPVYNAQAGLAYFVQQDVKQPIFTDLRTRRMMEHLLGYQPQFDFKLYSEKSLPGPCDCYLLINWEILSQGLYHSALVLDPPPAAWKPVKIIKNPAQGFGVWSTLKALLGTSVPGKEPTHRVTLETQVERSKDAVIYYIP